MFELPSVLGIFSTTKYRSHFLLNRCYTSQKIFCIGFKGKLFSLHVHLPGNLEVLLNCVTELLLLILICVTYSKLDNLFICCCIVVTLLVKKI